MVTFKNKDVRGAKDTCQNFYIKIPYIFYGKAVKK